MRSLALKLTLAFLLIGLAVAGLVAFFVGQQTQREFNQFVLDRYELDIIAELAQFYENNDGWDNLNAVLIASQERGPGAGRFRRNWAPVTIVDADGIVIAGGSPQQVGRRLGNNVLRAAAPIMVDGEVVGRVLLPEQPGGPNQPDSPESRFINAVQRAILYSMLGAAVIALLLGIFLARTISGPVRELTRATHRVAAGDLGHEVPVRTGDEIGELATSFNQMSIGLARANQLRRQMTADIAHDLRTPTSVIMGYAEALSDGKLPGTPEVYGTLHKEAQHLNHLIEDLRLLSLADAGELPLNPRPISPLDLLQQTAASYAVQAGERGIRLVVEPADDPPLAGLPAVLVDPDRMAQVLGNLVSNALRYTPDGGEIRLTAVPVGGAVELRVADNGRGIPAEDLPHIFRRFYRSDKSRTQSGQSGLGLAIARSIVEAHGGAIRAESAPGQGSTFVVTLPIGRERNDRRKT